MCDGLHAEPDSPDGHDAEDAYAGEFAWVRQASGPRTLLPHRATTERGPRSTPMIRVVLRICLGDMVVSNTFAYS
jgi:hypothetical protein